MSDYTKTFRAAAVQAEPVWNDIDGGIDKTIALVSQAASEGADIIAFPEVWIPGYPWFLWLDSVAWQSQFILPYVNNSIEVGSSQFARIEKAARDAGIAISLGFSERENGSLYISQAFIDKHGVTTTVRRKLKPTHVERTMFGEGDGSDIQVIDTELGRVGALNCWEHLQPLAKYAMFSQGEQLHIAAWPSFSIFEGAVNALGPEVNVGAARQYAVEGQTFVLSPTGLIGEAGQTLVADTELKKQFLALGGGYARIFGPDGRDLAEPLAPTEEGILYADIDYTAILTAKNAADPVGHYSRPDVFRLYFDNTRKSRVVNRPLSPTAEPVDSELATILEG
ncbi:carbon-nitrogen hydrolase family protein [Rhodococcus sp. WS1]|uniref:carbon-nitrogen hydrolase family protein n=1 Tax=unclassified Rhodococcus (in: high G+C Gram-positive bacteria) TaxID=192944 RepID=UPI0011419417|nr:MULTISPECIES: carbon-nitrogen hydrolase family protein [unclassified Rhodococcus (in: high G+C Gram-positive bacteria)]ROZ52772.1 carbon-nitrogen hydrolase family protein [Rhodococcus sp. WS1]TQC34296.1 carbon-nitrogen hydrolase family protein [Rhodococcus sp. WS7]